MLCFIWLHEIDLLAPLPPCQSKRALASTKKVVLGTEPSTQKDDSDDDANPYYGDPNHRCTDQRR